MTKRCKFCAHKLDAAGYCTNPKCPEYTRGQIEKQAAKEAGGKENGPGRNGQGA